MDVDYAALPDELFDPEGRVCVFLDGGAQFQDDARFTRSGGGAQKVFSESFIT